MKKIGLLSLFSSLVLASSALAITYDLTTAGSSAVVNGATFQQIPGAVAGTGNIVSFVRVQGNGIEEGFNATVRPVMTNVGTDPNFTRDIRLSDVPVVNGAYEFLLDINQTLPGSLLSLDALRIFTRSVLGGGALATAASLTDLTDALNIQQRYSLDTLLGNPPVNNSITLNYALNHGSGKGDLAVYVPTAFFAGSLPTDFVYLYSRFGENFVGNDGFEEWNVRVVETAGVGDGGSTVAMLGAVLFGIGLISRREWFGSLHA